MEEQSGEGKRRRVLKWSQVETWENPYVENVDFTGVMTGGEKWTVPQAMKLLTICEPELRGGPSILEVLKKEERKGR